MTDKDVDMVNHPPHYTSHPSGVETLKITQNMDFCIGNAAKYLMRHKNKGNPVEDLNKALFYIETALKNHMYFEPKEGILDLSVTKWYIAETNVRLKCAVMSLCLYVEQAQYYNLKVAQTLALDLLAQEKFNEV